jgi:hypothetical protein
MSDDNFSDDLSLSDRNEATAGDLAKRRVAAILRTERPLPEQEDALWNSLQFFGRLYANYGVDVDIFNYEKTPLGRILMFGGNPERSGGMKRNVWVSTRHVYRERHHKPPANVNVRSKFLRPLC